MDHMSDNANTTLPNSLEIIERFGGIRPMATKLDVPVTTVQGWKKREAIPLARKKMISEAAQAHDVSIDDLLVGAAVKPTEAPSAPSRPVVDATPVQAEPKKPTSTKTNSPAPSAPAQPRPVTQESAAQQKAQAHIAASELQARSSQSLINGIVGGVSLAALAGVLGLLILTGPKVKESKKQSEKIAHLEQKLEEVSEKQSMLQKIVPSDLNKKIGEIKQQTAQVKQNMSDLAAQASVISKTVMGAEGGSIAQRLQSLEGEINRFAEFSGSSDLASFVGKLSSMQQSMEGQEQLQSAMSELWGAVDSLKADKGAGAEKNAVDEALDEQRTESSALNQTFGDLDKKDLKAAAMLMGLAQLRGALGRDNKSFEKDLALMQKLIGSEDEQLNAALQELAPKAKHGVLTAGGLSRELRTLGGDIVSSSLQGEDVSWREKAKARMNNVLKVEKDGALITGTKTQERIDAAQYYLDKGDVESAYMILNELQGPAREPAAMLIEKLKTTALAGQVETMLTGRVMQNVMGFDLSALKEGMPTDFLTGDFMNGDFLGGLNMQSLQGMDAQSFKGLVDSFENMMPARELIEDPVSGYQFMDGGMGGAGGLPKLKAMPSIGSAR
jgi:hypothetical protein